MKKWIALLLAVIMLLSLTACGKTESKEDKKENGAIAVDEGLLTVEITMDAQFFTDTTEEEIKEEAKENGFLDCTVHEDGSVTYKMSKLKHKEAQRELADKLDEAIAEILTGEDKPASFVDIKTNDDYSQVDIFVDADTYTSWDNLYALTFYITGAYYQAFSGVPMEEVDVVVQFIDNETKEVLNTASYREFAENAQQAETSESA